MKPKQKVNKKTKLHIRQPHRTHPLPIPKEILHIAVMQRFTLMFECTMVWSIPLEAVPRPSAEVGCSIGGEVWLFDLNFLVQSSRIHGIWV